jgi:DNA-binding NtrC family response regulator
VRELRNVIERSLILGYFFFGCVRDEINQSLSQRVPDYAPDLPLAEVEKRHILNVLASVGGNKSEAARRLQVSRKTLERKCAAWGDEAAP